MLNNSIHNFDLNKFLSQLKINKQYSNKLKSQRLFLNNIKKTNHKHLSVNLKKKNRFNTLLTMWTLNIQFSRSNTLFNVTDCSGNIKLSYSAGLFNFKGRQKRSRSVILKHFYKQLVSKLPFIKKTPLIIHLKNVGVNSFWFLRKLKRKFFIVSVKSFNSYIYNGCRKKKIRRF